MRTGAAANGAGTLVGGHRALARPGGQVLNHQVGVSCFAEYAVVNRGSLVKVRPDLPPEVAAVFGCAVLTGSVPHSIQRRCVLDRRSQWSVSAA